MADKLSIRLNTAKGLSQLRFKEMGIVQGYNNLYFWGASIEEIDGAKTGVFNMHTKRRYYSANICVGVVYTF